MGSGSSHYPRVSGALPEWQQRRGAYVCAFARNASDLHAVQRLRYRVFNQELGEGLESAHDLERDEDHFDATSHHLVVRHAESDEVVGTYRLLTRELVGAPAGFYSMREFDLGPLEEAHLDRGLELGRACIDKGHRSGGLLALLWSGIARYLRHNRKRYLFGCASLPEGDPGLALAVGQQLAAAGHFHPELRIEAQPGFQPPKAKPQAKPPESDGVAQTHGETPIPELLRAYLGLGAKVCGSPAWDREFGTIDYFVLLDVEDVDPRLLARLTRS